jgi:hypothetical protein
MKFACPKCDHAIQLRKGVCSKCGFELTLQSLIKYYCLKAWKRWDRFRTNITPLRQRIVQWLYLCLSIILLLFILSGIQENDIKDWLKPSALALFFFPFLGLIVLLVVPGQLIKMVVKRAAWRIKVALVCNFFTLVLLLQLFIARWWVRALVLASILGVIFIGSILLYKVFWPMALKMQNLYDPQQNPPFDPSAPQGRHGRFE